jgi:hypothetical protein
MREILIKGDRWREREEPTKRLISKAQRLI